jgi:hypothetical protein
MNKKKFTITYPIGTLTIVIALGIVYDWTVAWITFAMLTVLGTIMENWL